MVKESPLETLVQQEPQERSRVFKILNWATGTALEDILALFREGLGYGTVKGREWKRAAKSAAKNTLVAATSWYLMLPWYVATHEAAHVTARRILQNDRANISDISIDPTFIPHAKLIQYIFPFFEQETREGLMGSVSSMGVRELDNEIVFLTAPYALAPLGIYTLKKGVETRSPVLIGMSLSYAFSQFCQPIKGSDVGRAAVYTEYLLWNVPDYTAHGYDSSTTLLVWVAAACIYAAGKGTVYAIEKAIEKVGRAIKKFIPTKKSRSLLGAVSLYAAVGLAMIPFSKPDRPEFKREEGLEKLEEDMWKMKMNNYPDKNIYDKAITGLKKYEDRLGGLCDFAGEAGARMMLHGELEPEQFRADLQPYAGKEAVDSILANFSPAQMAEKRLRERIMEQYPATTTNQLFQWVHNDGYSRDAKMILREACREARKPDWIKEEK